MNLKTKAHLAFILNCFMTSLHGHAHNQPTVEEKYAIGSTTHFYKPQYSHGDFQGLSMQVQRQTKTAISNIPRPCTISTTKLLSLEQINNLENHKPPHNAIYNSVTFLCDKIKSCLNAPE